MNGRLRIALGLVLVALLGLLAGRLRTSDALATLLPPDGEVARALELADRFRLADLVLFEVDGGDSDRETLRRETRRLAEALAESPSFLEVRWGPRVEDGLALSRAAGPVAPQLVPAADLERRTSDAGVSAALRAALGKLAGPTAGLFEARIAEDPLDVTGLALERLKGAGQGWRVRAEDGLLLDETGTRALLVVQPAQSALDAGPESTLPDEVQAIVDQIELPVRWSGGPRIAVASARAIHADVQRASALGLALLAAVILFGFRSLGPLLGALPILGVTVAGIGAAVTFLGPLHPINLAFFAALLGMAADYWIHLEAARAGEDDARDPRVGERALRRILPGLAMASTTTLVAFLVLTTSGTPIIRNLGVAGAAATLAALAGTALFGPFLARLIPAPRHRLRVPTLGGSRPLAAFTLVLLAGAAALAPRGRFDGDPRHLLPEDPDARADEAAIGAHFGGAGAGGMVVVTAPSLDEVLARTEAIGDRLRRLDGVQAVDLSALLPSPATRLARQAALPPAGLLQERIDRHAEEAGFAPGIFAGAAERLHAAARAPLGPDTWAGTPLETLVRQHLQPAGDGWSGLVSIVAPDDLSGTVEELAHAVDPGAEVVLPARFATRGIAAIASELTRLGLYALLGVLGILAFRYRDPVKVAAALLPALSALVLAAAALVLLDRPWNASAAGAMVLVLGLGIDYGVFVLEGTRGGHAEPARLGVFLSALTTMAGFGALAVARAPALSTLGIVLLAGMSAAAWTALVLTPFLARIPRRGRLARWTARLALLALLAWNLDILLRQLTALRPPPGHPPAGAEAVTAGLDRRFGASRWHHEEGVDAALLVGSPWERGYAAGRMMNDLDLRLETQLLATFERTVPSPLARFAIERGAVLAAPGLDRWFPPEVRAEIAGFAAGSPSPYDRLAPGYMRRVYYHALHDIGQALVDSPVVQLACTGFVAGGEATADGHWLLARDFDFDGGSLFDLEKTVIFVVPEEGIPFASVGFPGFFGVVTGLNAEGLAVAVQAGASAPPIRPGTPLTIATREVLQHASSLDEAEAILDRRRGFVSDNVLVVDGDAGEAAVFEVSPERVERLDARPWLAVSNHFRAPAFADDPVNLERQREGTTVPRLRRMESLVSAEVGRLDTERALAILQDRAAVDGSPLPPGHRQAINADIATHGVVIDATARRIVVSRYPNLAGGFVAFDLDAGLSGNLRPTPVAPAGDIGATLDVHRAREAVRAARRSEPAEAESLARKALTWAPGHPAALLALARALAAQGRDAEAREAAERALAAPPEEARQEREIRALLAEVAP